MRTSGGLKKRKEKGDGGSRKKHANKGNKYVRKRKKEKTEEMSDGMSENKKPMPEGLTNKEE